MPGRLRDALMSASIIAGVLGQLLFAEWPERQLVRRVGANLIRARAGRIRIACSPARSGSAVLSDLSAGTGAVASPRNVTHSMPGTFDVMREPRPTRNVRADRLPVSPPLRGAQHLVSRETRRATCST
jgi:hypothetical protein